MDHVSANKMLPVTERENISGARVFDGEDQGKSYSNIVRSQHKCQINGDEILIKLCLIYRCWKQIQNATVTIKRLVRIANC